MGLNIYCVYEDFLIFKRSLSMLGNDKTVFNFSGKPILIIDDYTDLGEFYLKYGQFEKDTDA